MPTPIPVAGLTPRVLGSQGVAYGGPAIVATMVDFSAQQTYIFNFVLLQQAQTFGTVRSIYANNSTNPNKLNITVQGTQENIMIPAFSVGMLPLSCMPNDVITVDSLGGASGLVEIEFYNYERPPYVYQGLSPFVPGSQVEALVQAAASLINRNTTLAPAVAANVFPTVATVRQLRFKNVGGVNGGDAFYNVGNTASGSFAAGDKFLQVGDSLVLPYRTAQRISFFSTLGCDIEGEEWSD